MAATATRAFYGPPASPALYRAATGVTTSFNHGLSTVIQLTGDSTGDGSGVTPGDVEWFYLLGNRLGNKWPAYNVVRQQWNDTNSSYDTPYTVQSGPNGETYVHFTGTSSGAQYQAASITGDLRIEFRVRLANYANGSSSQVVVAQYTSSGNQICFDCGFTSAGRPYFEWSTDGTTTGRISKTATATPSTANGAWCWIAVEHDVDNGASGNDVKFYTGSQNASTGVITWTQLGSTVTTSGVTSHFNSTGPYTIGSRDSSHALCMTGDIAQIRVRNALGSAGNSVVPWLPDLWDNTTAVTGDNAQILGSPTLLLVNGSQGGQNISYFDDSVRRPKLFSPKGQQLVLLSTGHNDDNPTSQTWITNYSTWVGHIQTLLPGVPIVCVTQDPAQSPARATIDVQARSRRGAALATWAAAQAGLYCIDTYPAFTDPTNQINTDGVHPLGPGSQVWCDYVYKYLFGF